MSLKLKVKLGRISGVVHTCEWCKYSTRSLNLFESHLNKCSPSASSIVPTVRKPQPRKKKKYWHKCDSCDFTANMIKEMTRHKAKFHGLKVIPCKECDYLARNRSKLNRHIGYRHNKNKINTNGSAIHNRSNASINSSSFETTTCSNFDASMLNGDMDNFDFKLNKYYNEVFSPTSTLDEGETGRNLSCRLCGFTLSNDEQVLNHLQNFHLPNNCIEHEIQTTPLTGKRKSCDLGAYRCKSCNFSSEYKMIIVGHIIDCHPSCLVSARPEGTSEVFDRPHGLGSIKKEQPKTYAYSCQDCLYKTNFKRNLKLHRTHHGADAPFQCTKCNFAAFHEIAVSRHRNNYHLPTTDSKATFANVAGGGEEGLRLLLDAEIKEEPTSDVDSKTVCAEASPSDRLRLEEKQKKNEQQIWQCSYCPSRRYSDQKGLLKHMRVKHEREGPVAYDVPTWRCPVCPFVGRSRKNLKMHMNKKKHGEFVESECYVPPIVRPDDVGEGGEGEGLPRVGKSGSTRVHYEDGSGRPFFKCDHCSVSFSTYQAIAVHVAKAHKNDVVYKCHDCPFTSNRKYLLRNHLHACSKDGPSLASGRSPEDSPDPSAEPPEGTECEEGPMSPRVSRDNTELVKYYGCSKCAYKTFRNFNLKKHIRLIHKGAKMIEILCQEEVHSTQDLECKAGSTAANGLLSDGLACPDVEIKREEEDDDEKDVVVSTVDLMDEETQTRHFQGSERIPMAADDGADDDLILVEESEKQKAYYCDSKRMKCYKCLFCPKVTRGWNHYILHRKMHFDAMANSKHKCKHCSFCSASLKFLKKHEALHGESRTTPMTPKENLLPLIPPTIPLDQSGKFLHVSAPPEYRVKSGYRCDACPFRAKDLKTFYVHKNLHTPRGAKNKCTKCTYEVDCISKLRVHSKVHTMEYLLSNYKSVNSKESRDLGRASSEGRLEVPAVCGPTMEASSHIDRGKLEEIEDFMEAAKNKHQIVLSRRTTCALATFNSTGKGEADDGGADPSQDKDPAEGQQGRRAFAIPSIDSREGQSSKGSSDLGPAEGKVISWHCERCPYVGRDSESLHRHATLHANKRTYECLYCNYSVPTYFYLLEHMKLHQAPNGNLLYAQSANNLQFIEDPEEARPDRGPLCEGLYEDDRSFLSVPAKAFKCTHCPFSSRLRIFLVKHLKGHVTRRERKCPFCTYSADSRIEIKKHCRIHFNLPGSEMNPYPESGRTVVGGVGGDGQPRSCEVFADEFMEDIYARFGLNEPEEKEEEGEWINKPLGDLTVGSETQKDVVGSGIFCTRKPEESEVQVPSLDCKSQPIDKTDQGAKEADKMEDDADEEEKEKTKSKEADDEDLYIEIDEMENSEDPLDASGKDVEVGDAETPKDQKQEEEKGPTGVAEAERPLVCRFCGRLLKCSKSLGQHEAAHLGQCSYLKLTNPELVPN